MATHRKTILSDKLEKCLITLLQKQVYKVKTKIRNAFSTKINSVGLPILALSLCVFLGTTWIASKEGVKHMPAYNLQRSDNLLRNPLRFLFVYKSAHKGKQWKTIIILSILNFAAMD
jgi:hypothetical protein